MLSKIAKDTFGAAMRAVALDGHTNTLPLREDCRRVRIGKSVTWITGLCDKEERIGQPLNTAYKSFGKAVVQEGGNIARSLGHGHNLNGP